MKALLDDLTDYSRRKLGLGISIEPGDVDLGALCGNEVRQHRAAHPDSTIELTLEGNLHGHGDGLRLQQVLRNLLSNATAYGTPGEPVRVAVYGEENEVRLEVRNTGPSIEAAAAEHIFEPLRWGSLPGDRANPHGLGLGLYIVREITRAHGGEGEVHSHGGETVFSVRLPRVSEGSDECRLHSSLPTWTTDLTRLGACKSGTGMINHELHGLHECARMMRELGASWTFPREGAVFPTC